MKGLVVKNTGSWYTVRTDDGQLLDCKVKGNFRIKGIRSTNPVAVGDRVTVSIPPTPSNGKASPIPSNGKASPIPAEGGETHHSPLTTHHTPVTPSRGRMEGAWITAIEDRRNYIIRKSINLSKQSHILAANVDQALLVVTVVRPETSTTFIDRFLASAEAYRVPVILVFNKTDLLDDDARHYQEAMVNLYETVGYECRQISAETGMGVEELRPLLEGKITLLSGNSGVGKSTLINRLVPGVNLRTADVSDAHNTGMHTTTFSEMIPLTSHLSSLTSYLIDTPGIKGFGTFDMEREELTSYFKEIFEFSKQCRFSDCSHTHEPGCAVLKAVEDHYIAQSRYQSYLSMLDDKDESKYREAY